VCIVPRDAARLTGNWDVMGLVGTGSFDYEVPEQFVPAGYTFERTTLVYERGGPLFSFGVPGFASAGHTAVALGITARALEEVAVVAAGKKRPAYLTVVGDHPLFGHGFAEKEAAYQAARAYAHQVFSEAERTVHSGAPLSAATRQRFRQVATYTHYVAADVVGWCYSWAGTDALRHPSALGRCQRDILGATQHVYVDPATMVDAGAEILTAWREGREEA
jgi:alkylation response protein AidB-like acyl-CoA dehydrogenase